MKYHFENIDSISEKLLSQDDSVAIAESVTGGLLQFAFSNAHDASNFYQGGITAYNLGQKYKHLHVEPIHALAVNCVSQQVARQMAMHVCTQFASDWGLAITGYATACPESNNELFAHYAIVFQGTVLRELKVIPENGTPGDVQLWYVNLVLREFHEALNQNTRKKTLKRSVKTGRGINI